MLEKTRQLLAKVKKSIEKTQNVIKKEIDRNVWKERFELP